MAMLCSMIGCGGDRRLSGRWMGRWVLSVRRKGTSSLGLSLSLILCLSFILRCTIRVIPVDHAPIWNITLKSCSCDSNNQYSPSHSVAFRFAVRVVRHHSLNHSLNLLLAPSPSPTRTSKHPESQVQSRTSSRTRIITRNRTELNRTELKEAIKSFLTHDL